MSPLLAGLLLLGGGALSGFGGAALNVWLARRTAQDDQQLRSGQLELQGRREADLMRSQAYRDAYDVRQGTITDLLQDVARLKLQVSDLQQQNAAAERAATEARQEAAEARRTTAEALAAVEDYVETVQGLLHDAGIEVPAFVFHHRTAGEAGERRD